MSMTVNHGDHFGGAGINAILTGVALTDIDESRHVNPPGSFGVAAAATLNAIIIVSQVLMSNRE
jgi:hypothetical protein